MINLKELRVDNWVYNSYTNQNIQVYPMMIPQLHRIEKENGSLKDCNIEPIPLTEEILLKCGFEINNCILEKEGIRLFKIRDLYFRGNFPIKSDIKCLHQLQNLYFALTGKELEINL